MISYELFFWLSVIIIPLIALIMIIAYYFLLERKTLENKERNIP